MSAVTKALGAQVMGSMAVTEYENSRLRAGRDSPEGGDVAAYVARGVSSAGFRFAARVTVHAPATEIAARITPAVGDVEAIDDRSCVLATGADSAETVAVYLGLLDADFTVSEPPELVERLRMLADRYQRACSAAAEPAAPPVSRAGRRHRDRRDPRRLPAWRRDHLLACRPVIPVRVRPRDLTPQPAQ